MSDLSEFLYRIQPGRPEMLTGGPTDAEATRLEQHFSYLEDLTARGVVQLAGRTLDTDETAFGIVLFRAASRELATAIMNDDPAVKHGVMKATLFPFRVVLSSS